MDYSDYRAEARDRLRGNWGTAALVTLVAGLLGVSHGGSNIEFDMETVEDLDRLGVLRGAANFVAENAAIIGTVLMMLALIYLIISGAIYLGYNRYILNLYDRAEARFSDLFSQFENFGNAFALNLLTGLFVFLWSLLFVIPGIVAGYSYAMAPFIMLDHPELSASECIRRSKELMYGHRGELFTLELTFIGWILLSVFTLGIGDLFLQPYIYTSRAAFYRDLVGTPEVVDTQQGGQSWQS